MEEVTRLSNQVKDVRDELNILATIARHQLTVQRPLNESEKRQENAPAAQVSDAAEIDRMAEWLRVDYSAAYAISDINEMIKTADRLQQAVG